MKIKYLVLVFLLSLVLEPTEAKKKDKEEKKNQKTEKVEIEKPKPNRPAHPVLSGTKLHPVHDDKIIGKFKNADKFKEEIKDIDHKNGSTLSQELNEIETELKEKTEIAKKQKEKLEKLKLNREKLEKSKEELNKESNNPVTGLMNKLGSVFNQIELDQNKIEIEKSDTSLAEVTERLEQLEMLKSYIQSKN